MYMGCKWPVTTSVILAREFCSILGHLVHHSPKEGLKNLFYSWSVFVWYVLKVLQCWQLCNCPWGQNSPVALQLGNILTSFLSFSCCNLILLLVLLPFSLFVAAFYLFRGCFHAILPIFTLHNSNSLNFFFSHIMFSRLPLNLRSAQLTHTFPEEAQLSAEGVAELRVRRTVSCVL